jgi:hypothetical protein
MAATTRAAELVRLVRRRRRNPKDSGYSCAAMHLYERLLLSGVACVTGVLGPDDAELGRVPPEDARGAALAAG